MVLNCRMTPAIDPEVLENKRMSHFVGHSPKPAHIRYNQVVYDLDRDMGDHVPESPMMRGEGFVWGSGWMGMCVWVGVSGWVGV